MSETHSQADMHRRTSGATRRAIVRWAWRLFRREWQQQGLVFGLLTVAVAATIMSASIAYNVAPAAGRAEFGAATHLLKFDGSDPAMMRADLASAAEWFDETEAITSRSVAVPGAFDTLEIRGQNPEEPFGGPMLDLLEGRYPRGANEIAVTESIIESFALHLGALFAIDGGLRTVVGIVENPNNLRQEFALVDPSHEKQPESVTILVQASDDHVFQFRSPSMSLRSSRGSQAHLETYAALSMLGTASVGMVFVALIATASFMVVAQRRLRQLGMLAAIGATQRHLGLVTLANGVVVGIVAALVGAVLGLVSWIGVVPFVEEPFGHRIDWLSVPWWLVGTAMLLAVVTATAAAWWPARAVARVPITLALTGRPPRAATTHRSRVIATVLILSGIGCLVSAQYAGDMLVILGTLAAIVGVLLLSPSVIEAAALLASRVPVAMRIALRDMARYQARSGAALAAVSLALLIATSITISASAAELGADEGNLSDRQLMVRIGDPDAPILPPDFSPFIPDLTWSELEAGEDGVDRIARLFAEARVIPLDVAVDPELGFDPRFEARSAVTLAEFMAHGPRPGYRDLTMLYVATPEMLEYYGVELATIDADTKSFTVERGELWITGISGTPGVQPPKVQNARILPPQYSSLPGSFITKEALREHGWDTMRAGWLIEANTPLTSTQIAEARRIAAEAGLTIEHRDQQKGVLALRTRATATGMILALSVITMTVGLIRNESSRDLRILTATGAASSTRRMITATTAGVLALLGVTIGTTGAYLVLAMGYVDRSRILETVPLSHLTLTILGVPLAAVLIGWATAGGEPPMLPRQPIE